MRKAPAPRACADAPEVETHRAPAALNKGTRQGLHDLVVHGAAMQRMRVGDNGHAARWYPVGRRVGQRLDNARAAEQGQGLAGRRIHAGIAPGTHRPSTALCSGIWRNQQAFDDLAVSQMAVDDFVDVGQIRIAVPHAFRINHRHRCGLAPSQATGAVNPHVPRTAESQFLDALFAMRGGGLRTVIAVTVMPRPTLVGAEKNVPRKMRRRRRMGRAAPGWFLRFHGIIVGAVHERTRCNRPVKYTNRCSSTA